MSSVEEIIGECVDTACYYSMQQMVAGEVRNMCVALMQEPMLDAVMYVMDENVQDAVTAAINISFRRRREV